MNSSTVPMFGNPTQQGYVLSITLHVAVLAAAWTGMPFLARELPEETSLIIDLVPIDEITASAPRSAPEPDPEPAPQTPEPQQAEAPPPSDAMPPPPEKPAPPPEQVAEAPPPPTVRPQPKPRAPPTKEDDIALLSKLLKDLDQKDAAQPDARAQDADVQQPSNNIAPTLSSAPTMSELDAIQRHIEDHWRIDPGREGVANLSVEIKINVSTDGTVQQAQILDQRYYLDDGFRIFANSARNAVLAASPLPINPSNADAFREMILVFSPQGRIN
ncbi:MAG: TonB C-terminal domain-containing protein [Rhodospirillaceae bacterium]